MFPETIEIHVTQANIDRGRPEDCTHCPIALATLDAIDTVGTVIVDYDHIKLEWPSAPNAYYPLPPSAEAFIADFDDDGDVAPFSFTTKRQDTWP